MLSREERNFGGKLIKKRNRAVHNRTLNLIEFNAKR